MTLDPEATAAAEPGAVLVGVQLPGMSEAELESSLDELARLVRTLGLRPIARLTQRRSTTGGGAVLGKGKLKELARLTGGSGVVPPGASRRQTGSRPADREADADAATEAEAEAGAEAEAADGGDEHGVLPSPGGAAGERATVVVFDHDLSPSQLRNLESATGAEVHDRSSIIVAIFQRHARTREARLQVEIARLSYLAPRLRAGGRGEDRQRGGIGGKGAGESSLELDRRRVRDRIAELKAELAAIEREEQTRRARRGGAATATVALVGYTNAGKSSLMRALTGSDILVADRLFATLDTTVRLLVPETKPRLLVSDTVGFIKKLPHDLVASFRSTLAEARDAELLVHVVDAADPAWRLQLEVTRRVLAEVGAEGTPTLLVLNKVDLLDAAQLAALAAEQPDALFISARRRDDIGHLRERIVDYFRREMVEEDLFVSYRDQRMVAEIHRAAIVLAEAHDEHGTRLTVRAPPALIEQLRAALVEPI